MGNALVTLQQWGKIPLDDPAQLTLGETAFQCMSHRQGVHNVAQRTLLDKQKTLAIQIFGDTCFTHTFGHKAAIGIDRAEAISTKGMLDGLNMLFDTQLVPLCKV